jgi:hypothetical protein
LLQHAKLVNVRPMLDDLAVLQANDVYFAPGRAFAGGWHTRKFAFHRAAPGRALDDPIPFSNDVLDSVLKVAEGGAQHGEELFGCLAGGRHTGRDRVLDVVGRDQTLKQGPIASVEGFYGTPGDGFVFFG